MKRYEYVNIHIGKFCGAKSEEHRGIINEYAAKGCRYVGYIPTKISGYGIITDLNLADHPVGAFAGVRTAAERRLKGGLLWCPLAAGEVHRPIRAEEDALCLQQRPLSAGSVGVECRFGAAEAVDHPVTGDGGVPASCHGIAHGSGAAGLSGQTGHLAVGGDGPRRDAADNFIEGLKDMAAHGNVPSLSLF